MLRLATSVGWRASGGAVLGPRTVVSSRSGSSVDLFHSGATALCGTGARALAALGRPSQPPPAPAPSAPRSRSFGTRRDDAMVSGVDGGAQLSGINADGVAQCLASGLSDPSLLKPAALIGNKWVASSATTGETTFHVRNPATGRVLAVMPSLTAEDAEAAVSEAARAFPAWAATPPRERQRVLQRWHDLLSEHRHDIARIMSTECGKPLSESLLEIASGLASVEWAAEEGKRVTGRVLADPGGGRRMMVLEQPVGVVAAITPWNFPFSMITRKVAPALAVGCTVVLKPAGETPLTAVAAAELAVRAGMPPGVLNVIHGDPPTMGDALCLSEGVAKVGFTGSTRVGRMLAAKAAGTMKKVTMELGGNAPVVVFEDADVDRAAALTVASALRNAGQTCICANRVLVHASVMDRFAGRVAKIVGKLTVGAGTEEGVTTGPLIRPGSVDRAAEMVADAVERGARVLVGGSRPSLGGELEGGNFFLPTVLAGVPETARCYREEQFAPLVALTPFETEDEAARMANDTEYGLAAYFFTKDAGRTWRFAEKLRFGMVGVNEVGVVHESAPFGGVKQSGLGRENGSEALGEFLEKKLVVMSV